MFKKDIIYTCQNSKCGREFNKIGFYSPGGRCKRPKNLNGLTRDHKVSVQESILNNYDAHYITHPINCRLITAQENSSKNKASILSYQDLIKLVDNYELALTP